MERALAACVCAFLCLGRVAQAQDFVACLDAAQAKIDTKNWAAALELLLPLQERGELDEDWEVLAVKLDEVGNALVDDARFAVGLSAWEASLAVRKRIHGDRDHSDVATSLNNAAYCLKSLGRAAAALPRYEGALAMRKRLYRDHDHPDVAASLNNVASCLHSLGRAREALPQYEEALAMWRRLCGDRDDSLVATSLNNVAGCLESVGRAAEALSQYEEALAMLRRLYVGHDHPHVATSLNNVAYCLEALGRVSEALPRYEEALALRRRLYGDRDHPDVATSLNSVAHCLQSLGRVSEALPLYEEALAMLRHVYGDLDHPYLAAGLNSVAYCLEALGRAAEALPRFEQALAMHRRLHGEADHPGVALHLNNVAYCLQSLGRTAEALPKYEAALAMRMRLYGDHDHPDVAASLHNVAYCLQSLGRGAEALPKLEASLAMWKRVYGDRDHPYVAGSLNNVAHCLHGLQRAPEALSRFELALAMTKRLYGDRDHPAVATCLNSVAYCLQSLGRTPEALPHATRACDMIERLRDGSRLAASLQQSFFDELKRGGAFERLQALAMRTDVSLAFAAAERSRGRDLLDLLEQQSFDPLAEAERGAQQRGDEQGIRRLQQLRADLVATELESDRLLHLLTQLDTSAMADTERNEHRARLLDESNAVASRRRQLLDERARRLGDALPAGRVRTVAEIQAALRQGEAFLEFTVANEASVLYVLGSNGAPEAIELPAAVATVRRLLPSMLQHSSPKQLRGRDPDGKASGTADADAASRELFASLFPGSLWQRLCTCKHLFVAAHRDLHRVPLESLVTAVKDGKPTYWLDEGPPISYVPSGTLLHWLRTRQRPEHPPSIDVLAIGDPTLGAAQNEHGPAADATRFVQNDDLERIGKLPRLQGARAEAEAIAAACRAHDGKCELLLGDKATETAVADLAGKAKYLHFACHGIAEEYAGQSLSMLVLAQQAKVTPSDDGFLKLGDLFRAWSGRLSSCRLVVLSACRTNVGPTLRDEAPQALPIGFFFAGVPSVISSLWAVDDASTKELMTDFYSRLLAGETDKLKAFTDAKKALRAKYPDPFHWAPFLFLGAPE